LQKIKSVSDSHAVAHTPPGTRRGKLSVSSPEAWNIITEKLLQTILKIKLIISCLICERERIGFRPAKFLRRYIRYF
jgi:hypothetical protein